MLYAETHTRAVTHRVTDVVSTVNVAATGNGLSLEVCLPVILLACLHALIVVLSLSPCSLVCIHTCL
jgi:hypothetical protein